MRNIPFVTILFIFILIGCEEEQTNTTLTIINNTDYAIMNVIFNYDWDPHRTFDFGTINRKESSTREIYEYSFKDLDYIGGISFNLLSTDGKTISCKTGRDVRINKNKNQFTFTNNTIVNHSNNKSDTIKDIAGTPKTSTLTINNMTDYNFSNVEYDSVIFGNINSGRDSKKNVSSGTKFIYFDLQLKNGYVRCRTEPFTCIDGDNNIIIINNTVVTITGSGTSDTIINIYNQ